MKHNQQGVTLVVVLVLMTVMLLGGMALARMTEIGTLASGNSAFREASMQASEIGVNTAFQAIQGLTDEETDATGWYFATTQVEDSNGVPTVSFDAAPEIAVGAYSVRYVVDRMCTGTLPIDDRVRKCLVKQDVSSVDSRSTGKGEESLELPTARQFRITVRVTGPKDTRVWVQSLITKG
jgi:type IV pilus assembly protein PilX